MWLTAFAIAVVQGTSNNATSGDPEAAVAPPWTQLVAEIRVDGAVLVRGAVGDRAGWFLLDSGAESTVIDKSFLGASATPIDVTLDKGIQTSATEPANLSTFIDRFDVPVEGLIGGNFFRKYALLIDYKSEKVYVDSSIDISKYAPDAEITVIKVERCLDIDDFFCVRATVLVGDRPVPDGRVFIDSASVSDVLVSLDWLARRRVPVATSRIVGRTPFRGAYLDYYETVPQLRLEFPGATVEPALGSALKPLFGGASIHYAGMLGAMYFRRHSFVLFDLPNDRIVLGPEILSSSDAAAMVFFRGATLDRNQDGSISVRAVVPGSAVECDGLMVGDTIIAVNGIDSDRYSLDWLTSFSALPENPIHIRVVRGETVLHLCSE